MAASDTVAGPGYHVGIDVGGTKILAVATPAEPARESESWGRSGPAAVLAEAEQATVTTAVPRIVDELVSDLRRQLAPAPLLGIGVGLPGLVTTAGVLRYGPNLAGAQELDLAGWLGSRHGVVASVDNDGNCAAWAEHRLGAGRGSDDMVFVGLGTGISCGLVVGGRAVRGRSGFAGEAGHMIVRSGGARCACGRTGCWEASASGSALAAQAQWATRQGRADSLVALAGGDRKAVRGEHVTAGLRVGEPTAVRIATAFAGWVALGLVNVVHLLDPAVVVLGGSVLDDAEPWMGLINAAYAELVMQPSLRTATTLSPAQLGRRAGAIGAAVLAREGEAIRLDPRV